MAACLAPGLGRESPCFSPAVSGQHIPRATVRGAINSRSRRRQPVQTGPLVPRAGATAAALRQGLIRETRAHRAASLAQPAPSASCRSSPAHCSHQDVPGPGRQLLGMSVWEFLLLLPQRCWRTDATTAGWLWNCSSRAGSHLGSHPNLFVSPR